LPKPSSQLDVVAPAVAKFDQAARDLQNALTEASAAQAALNNQLGGLGELSESTQRDLQQMMDERSRFIETLSNIVKKIQITADTQVQNLK
jgi:uncharacterized protein YukE